MFSKNLAFLFFSFSFLSGIFLQNIFLNYETSLIVLIFILVLFLNFNFYSKIKFYKLGVFALVWALVWIFFSNFNLENISENNWKLKKYYENSYYDIEFNAESRYKITESEKVYIAKINKIWSESFSESKINFLVTVPYNFDLDFSNNFVCNARILPIKDFESNFSYKNYMLSKNIFFTSYCSSIDKSSNLERNFADRIDTFRESLILTIKNLYPKDEASFLAWILFWAREDLDKELKDNFNNSWLTHLIAVSWFNITLLIVFLSYIFKLFPLIFRTIIITFTIIFFTIFVWESISVIRAAIMWLLWYYVMISWRQNNHLTIVFLTASFMVLFSPLSLNYDVSFHLSFLAVLWIIYTQKFFTNFFKFVPDFLAIKEALVMTMSALSFTLPIMIFNFWQVSILAPITNVLVTWTIPISMLLWFLSLIINYIYEPLTVIFSYSTWVFLAYDIKIVNFFWNLDFALLKVNFWIYKNVLEILYFVVLVFLINYFRE